MRNLKSGDAATFIMRRETCTNPWSKLTFREADSGYLFIAEDQFGSDNARSGAVPVFACLLFQTSLVKDITAGGNWILWW
jgi:hypothetical protein